MKHTDWLNLGYDSIIPIAPPGCGLPDAGKKPGLKDANGKWFVPTGWNRMHATPESAEAWERMGAGVGLVNDGRYFILDIDSYDERTGDAIERKAREMLGDAPRRVGQWPKRALFYRAAGPIPRVTVPYGEGRDRIETTPLNGQVVVQGTHPATGKPYEWDRPLPRAEDLPEVTPGKVRAFFDLVASKLPKAKLSVQASAQGEAKSPAELMGDPDLIREAVQAAPNPADNGWDQYIAMGQAIRGAFGPGNEAEAYEVWREWVDRWEYDGERTADPETNWGTMKQTRSLGMGYVLSKSTPEFQVKQFFQPVEDAVSWVDDMFVAAEPEKRKGDQPRKSVFAPVSVLEAREVREREWIVPDLVPNKTVTMLSGDGGTGKSLLAIQLAVAAVTGQQWLGSEVKQGPVLLISAEDDEDELHRRFTAVCRHYNVPLSALDNLIFRSLAGEDAVLGALTGKGGAIQPTPLFREIEEQAAKVKPVLAIFDTLADLFGGSEIDRIQTRQFVGILRGLSIRNDCASLLLSHPSVAGMASGTGSSGSTAWNASVRSRVYLERITENGQEPNPDARRLTTKKANYARTGGQIGLLWGDGVFEVDKATSGPLAGVEQNARAQAVFLRMLGEFTSQGRYVSANPGVSYAPRRFAKAGADGFTAQSLAAAMETLLRAGRIRMETHGRASKQRTHLVECSPSAMGFPDETPDDGLFD